MTNQAIAATLIGAGCALFSALVSGYVLWSVEEIARGFRDSIKATNKRVDDANVRISHLEERAMNSHA